MNTDLIIVKAKFALYSTDIGGRKTPIISGYRPNHVFEYKENSNDFIATYIGDVNFEGQEFLYPGELIVATVRFLRHGDIERFIQAMILIHLAKTSPFHAVRFDGRTYDTGSKLGFLAANVAFGLARPGVADGLRAELKKLLD